MQITDPARTALYYQALLERDSGFVGIFYAAVKTTGVFCISTCRARKPKPENTVFYDTAADAAAAGFRPCKICRPDRTDVPPYVLRAYGLLHGEPGRHIGDADLRSHGISPDALRRWFKQHYRTTFHAYQRMRRISAAAGAMARGSIADSAFEAGWQSLSGFAYSYRKYLGDTPVNAHPPIVSHRFRTPLGDMLACATEQGLCLLEFVGSRRIAREQQDLSRLLGRRFLFGENRHTEQAEREVGEYFQGVRRQFGVALHTPASVFQQTVWDALRGIPYGETTHYQALAARIGQPSAVRAVAAANGANRVSLIIPCHRVIGKDGSLTGYGGGLQRKQWLLEHESGLGRREADLFG